MAQDGSDLMASGETGPERTSWSRALESAAALLQDLPLFPFPIEFSLERNWTDQQSLADPAGLVFSCTHLNFGCKQPTTVSLLQDWPTQSVLNYAQNAHSAT